MNSFTHLIFGVFIILSLPCFSQNTDSIGFRNHYKQAMKHYKSSEYREAIKEWNNASQYSNSKYDKARCLMNKGICYKLLSKYDSAFSSYTRAKDLSTSIDSSKLLGKIHNNLGTACLETGTYQKAQEHLLFALKFKKQENDTSAIGSTLLNLGEVQLRLKNWERAKDYYLQSLKIRKSISDTFGIASCYINLGILRKKRGQFAKAQSYYNDILKLCEKGFSHDKNVRVVVYENIGALYATQGKLEKALSSYNLALDISQRINSQFDIAYCKNEIALIKLAQGSYNSAQALALEAFSIADNSNIFEKMPDYSMTVSNTYESLGNHKKAFEWLKKHGIYKDSLLTKDKIREIQGMEYEYKTSLVQKDNQIKDEQLKSKKIKLKSAYWMIFLFALLIISLIVLLIVRYRTRKQLARKNVELTEKNAIIEEHKKKYIDPLSRKIQVQTIKKDELKKFRKEELQLRDIVFMEKAKDNDKQRFSLIGEIEEKIGKNSFLIYTTSGSQFVKKISVVDSFETFLKDSSFSRVNASLIINLHFIKKSKDNDFEVSFKKLNHENKRFEMVNVPLPLAKTGKYKSQFLADFQEFCKKQYEIRRK